MALLYLEYNNLLNYLCSLGHFTFDDAIDGGLTIKKKQTKNNTFEVFSDNKKGVFVKQFTEFYEYPFNNLWREQLIRNYVPFYELALHADVQAAITGVLSADTDRQIIVTERIENLQRLKAIIESSPNNADVIFDKIIDIINNLHKTTNIRRNLKRKLEFTPYFFDRILSNSFRHRNKFDFVFWSKFQKHQDALSNFIKKYWTKQDALIHNDLSLNNIFLAENNTKTYLLDWEYLSIGDSLWDFASLIYDLNFSNQGTNTLYRTFIDKIYAFHEDTLSKEILAFYVVSITLWRKSIDFEKIENNDKLEKFLNECDVIIGDFETKLEAIVKKI